MNYEFGDIIDCRNVFSIKHFILILGTKKKEKEVMYYQITSRTYKVFRDILDFFNDCIDKENNRFFHYFGKEKGKDRIHQTGNLCDAFFLDKYTNYSSCLEKDSMVLINSEPEIQDKAVVDQWIGDKDAIYMTRLSKEDTDKLIHILRLSNNVSQYNKSEIGRNYNAWKRPTAQ